MRTEREKTASGGMPSHGQVLFPWTAGVARHGPQTSILRLLIASVLFLAALVFAPTLHAATAAEFAARARQQYQQARDNYSKSPKTIQPAWEFGRACYDLADFSTNSAERAEL